MNDGPNVISTHTEVVIIKHLSDLYYLDTYSHIPTHTLLNTERRGRATDGSERHWGSLKLAPKVHLKASSNYENATVWRGWERNGGGKKNTRGGGVANTKTPRRERKRERKRVAMEHSVSAWKRRRAWVFLLSESVQRVKECHRSPGSSVFYGTWVNSNNKRDIHGHRVLPLPLPPPLAYHLVI